MSATDVIKVVWNEDGDATALARVTARNGSGAATGNDGEGNFLQQADVTTITCSVFDRSSATPDAEIATPAVVVANAILDVVVATNEIWTDKSAGYNFIHDLAASNFPTGGHVYRIEYFFTLTGGATFPVIYEGTAKRRVAG